MAVEFTEAALFCLLHIYCCQALFLHSRSTGQESNAGSYWRSSSFFLPFSFLLLFFRFFVCVFFRFFFLLSFWQGMKPRKFESKPRKFESKML